MSRRTTTSTEVKARWNAASYKRYQVYLRELFRAALEKLKNESL